MNPILPKKYYIPDVEARQWEDGKVYLYGSSDICGKSTYCSYEYRVFSSWDLKEWEDHGIAFEGQEQGENSAVTKGRLYAPDCCCIDKKYYLFYCQENAEEGVAVSETPYGPFGGATPVEGANETQIDPAVFVEDDKNIYYYWGQISAKVGKLRSDLCGFEGNIQEGILTEEEHGFHEGISIRKRNNIYYLSYTDISRGNATCIGYATSKSPLGPFKKQGIIIDNTGCDPESWNNHGSITQINGKWYVFYHRSTHKSKFSRRVCIEPIEFDEFGLIKEVEMTTQGIEGPFNSKIEMESANACLLSGSVYIDSISNKSEFYEYLNCIYAKDWAAFKYYCFEGNEVGFEIEVASMTYGGKIVLHLDSPEGIVAGTVSVNSGTGWTDFQLYKIDLLSEISGIHALYLVFEGAEGRLMSIKNFHFL